MAQRQILVVDPAVRIAEVDCFNRIALTSPLPATYHLPGLVGMDSLKVTRAAIAGIVILGSSTSVHESRPWQRPLEEWLLPLMQAGTPTLGLCYGHQMIAHLLGGKVGFLFPDKHKLLGFRKISFDADPLWKNTGCDGSLFVSHRETVTECPPVMKVIGKSAEVSTDALAHKTLPIWSFQSHPEATNAFVRSQGAPVPPDDGIYGFGYDLITAFLTLAAGNPR